MITLRGGESIETKLRRIAEIARTKPKERFTSLIHLINAETLMQSHNNMKAGKAPGIDKIHQIRI